MGKDLHLSKAKLFTHQAMTFSLSCWDTYKAKQIALYWQIYSYIYNYYRIFLWLIITVKNLSFHYLFLNRCFGNFTVAFISVMQNYRTKIDINTNQTVWRYGFIVIWLHFLQLYSFGWRWWRAITIWWNHMYQAGHPPLSLSREEGCLQM